MKKIVLLMALMAVLLLAGSLQAALVNYETSDMV